MRTVRALLSAVATSDAPLVLTGERGTGKVRIARWLHANGPRANGPLVVVHCAALPVMTIEEHLLGRSGTPGALQQCAEANTQQLNSVVNLVRGQLTKLNRATLSSLVGAAALGATCTGQGGGVCGAYVWSVWCVMERLGM